MSEVLNATERSRSFLKFLLFFVITAAVMLIAVFFDFKIPSVENKRLKEEVFDQRQIRTNQERFNDKLEQVIILLDSIEKKPEAAAQLRPRINNELANLAGLNVANNTVGRMNLAIIEQLGNLNKANEDKERFKSKLADSERELQKCKGDVNDLRASQQ